MSISIKVNVLNLLKFCIFLQFALKSKNLRFVNKFVVNRALKRLDKE